MTFSERLIQLRKQRGWSQEQLGDQLHVTRQTISKWETGATTPEMNKLIELSDLFDLSIDALVGRTVPPPQPIYGRRLQYEYKSKHSLFGLPLLHINIGHGWLRASGIVAIGNIATGVVALGGLSCGVLAIGGVSAGLLALGGLGLGLLLCFGGLALGTIAVGGLAIGWIACGGSAVGCYAFGGAAIAARIAAGGYANGYIAIGDATVGTMCFDANGSISDAALHQAVTQAFPRMWSWLVDIICTLCTLSA